MNRAWPNVAGAIGTAEKFTEMVKEKVPMKVCTWVQNGMLLCFSRMAEWLFNSIQVQLDWLLVGRRVRVRQDGGDRGGYCCASTLFKVGVRESEEWVAVPVDSHRQLGSERSGKLLRSNIVWHTAFYELLESLVIPAKVGDWMTCGDRTLRWLWPIILILAADYEEACVMALIRGLTSMYPCPICFVPWQEQSDLSTEHPQRIAEDSKRLIQEARALRTAAEREDSSKTMDCVTSKGADPHEAISYDPLHADDGGFWGTHLFGQINVLRSWAEKRLGLNHFDSVMNTTLNDGSKHEDVAKTMLFVAHNVLVDEPGLLLLQALRSYLDYAPLSSLRSIPQTTLAVGRNELLTLDSTMKQYIAACEGTEQYANKDWNVPKFHSRLHVFDHIEKKRASRNFGTKTILSNIDIGSKLKPVSFAKLEQDMSHDAAFHRFRVKFGIFTTQFLAAHNYNLPNGQPVRFDGTDTISPFQFLKIHYESMSDWKWTADYLRCNPKFHGHPRYDCVLVKTTDKPIFAQLLYMFSCTVENKSHPLALILPLDAPTGNTTRKDKLLRFRRVRAQARKNSDFGGRLRQSGDFLVFDVLDGDTSLRLKIMYGHNFERRDKSALPTPEITVLTSKRRTNSSQDLAIESRVALLEVFRGHPSSMARRRTTGRRRKKLLTADNDGFGGLMGSAELHHKVSRSLRMRDGPSWWVLNLAGALRLRRDPESDWVDGWMLRATKRIVAVGGPSSNRRAHSGKYSAV
ncbi:hypothetical protein B0H13DRAFT_1884243 [Mycena leptocephala]|nr:hypothetical protein B0H13DRAFT_1884243 [Mycena leptocephala]